MSSEITRIENEVNQWLDNIVIGLNLCPFAAKPQRNNQIRIAVTSADNDEALLESVYLQLKDLDTLPDHELETTVVVVPNMLSDFDDYLFFTDWLNAVLKTEGWEGIYQIATFHPNYCFQGSQPEDSENLTNRSPYPIFHLIREASMEKVLAHYPNPDEIPEINIKKMEELNHHEREKLFHYLQK
ncbi:DUF1415 domain-containing protein [Vibrio sp. RC27]